MVVTRKPLPEHAALDPAVPAQARDMWTPNDGGDETGWRGIAIQDSQGQDVPNITGFGGESNVWAETVPTLAETEGMAAVPAVLRPGSHQEDADGAQAVLRSEVPKQETNPFKRKMSLGASSAGTAGEQGKQTPIPNVPPLPSLPVEDFSQLSINEPSNNPLHPALDGIPPAPRLTEPDSVGDNVWASAKPSRQPTPGPGSTSPALLSLPSEEEPAGWAEEPKKAALPPPLVTTTDEEVLEGSHAWDDLGTLQKGKGPAQPPLESSRGPVGADDWNLFDMETHPGPPPKQSTWEKFDDEHDNTAKTATQPKPEEVPPQLPPRQSAEGPPPTPPRPVAKSETYQIKNINWHDAAAAKNPRTSPILVQNANGPCPLVALVNALILTTPADQENTALVETLGSREQVSLGLLLDAVFEELMSGRRTQPNIPLPDVTELYSFLKGLHTGMNVNPRFTPTPEVVTAFRRTSRTRLHPAECTDMIPGTFEHTTEMALYSTFSIPLIHGWLPSGKDAAYDAFARQAASYEDAQNLLFHEEELEVKLSSSHHQGLSAEEQQTYQDILIIKSFLSTSATQLTDFGLDVIRSSMKPGSVAILFRNDHFSTLYRHPQTLELFTLVTDAGYAGHAEVVWESLVDVNGLSAEFFSGDFRPVGGSSHDQPHPSGGRVAPSDEADHHGWATIKNHRDRQRRWKRLPAEPPLSPAHEQEDRDLALALQLQDEEDERHRAEQEQRRKESLLSEQYIEQQARPAATTNNGASNSSASLASSTCSSATPRTARNGHARGASASASSASLPISYATTARTPRPTTQTVRSLLPPRSTAATATATATTDMHPVQAAAGSRPGEGLDDDAPPPTYEQAAKQLPYVPPAGHPSHPASSPTPARGELSMATTMTTPPPPGGGAGGGGAHGRAMSQGSGSGYYPGQGYRGYGGLGYGPQEQGQGQGQGQLGRGNAQGLRRGSPTIGPGPSKDKECTAM